MTPTDLTRRRAGPRAGRPGPDYLRSVLELLHPGATLELRSRPGRPRPGEWSLLPTAGAPRLAVPTQPRRAALAAVSDIGSGGLRGALRHVAELVVAAGGLALTQRVGVIGRAGHETICTVLGEVVGEPVTVSMAVGRERALQKPVLRALAGDGRTVAFVKVGVSPVTCALVDHEATVLARLAGAGLRRLRAPSVLGHRAWNGLSILVLEPLHVTAAPGPDLVSEAALELGTLEAVSTAPLAESPAWAALVDRVGRLPSSPSADLLADAVERLARCAAGTRVRSGAWHGDFAPWNMGSDGDRLLVWDWEGYGGPVPAGLDVLHHHFQRRVVLEGLHPALAVGELAGVAPRLLEPWQPVDPQLVVTLYLLVLVTGLLESGDDKTRISRLDGWLDHAVPAQLARLDTGAP